MQISRHWRLNPQRYRLQGVRYTDGSYCLQNRPQPYTTNLKVAKDCKGGAVVDPKAEVVG